MLGVAVPGAGPPGLIPPDDPLLRLGRDGLPGVLGMATGGSAARTGDAGGPRSTENLLSAFRTASSSPAPLSAPNAAASVPIAPDPASWLEVSSRSSLCSLPLSYSSESSANAATTS